jgi:(E)-4-hydroxy-3-methylbut-2-enyl-diphosphate synthase
MTNTDTVDAIGTAIQVKELAIAGSEMVRITVNTPEAAQQVPYIREQLDRMGIDVPLIGDFPLQRPPPADGLPGLCRGPVQVPHQPRQRGQGRQARPPVRPDDRGRHALEQAGAHRRQLGQPRPGAAGQPDGREQPPPTPWDAKQVMYEALVTSAIDSARRAEEMGMDGNQIILSCKVSGVQDLIACTANWPALRLRAAPGPDRSRHGHQGHGGLRHGAVHPAAGGHRRHHPRVS